MKKRILIADDEAALLKTMAFTLKRKGYETVTFENGRNAYNAIIETFKRGELFDLI
ncbi:MAG: DNA-binding response regulator, partial [Candidatus Cloacimonetes bacterium]|nr:DNA-binding response regulator [Candidatus Cloacimonadota bacterium]MBT4333437.1 DNA-binding response regulator [Candidatus Cloacimonadota bacterium]